MVTAVCDFAKGLVCDAQGSAGDFLIAPCRSYHNFFAKKLDEASGFDHGFWFCVHKIASVAYLVLAPLALLGGAFNLCCIPFTAILHHFLIKADLLKEIKKNRPEKNRDRTNVATPATSQSTDGTSAAPEDVVAADRLLEQALQHVQQLTLKNQTILGFARVGNQYEFTVGIWRVFGADPIYIDNSGQTSEVKNVILTSFAQALAT